METTFTAEADAEADRTRLDRATVAAVSVLALAAFMSVLDGTIVTSALDTFGTVFDSPLSTVVWVSVGYLLAAGLALPTSAWAIGRFGGRRVFLAGLALFLLGSGLASIAWSTESLIAFRVVQGFGGGALEPTALTLAAGIAGQQRVGKVIGALSIIVNVAPVLGPLTGGLFATEAHWRWIFLVNLPIGAVVAIAALTVLPSDRPDADDRERVTRSDLRGLLLLSPGFTLLLFAIDRVGADGAWWTIAVPAVAGAALFGAYVRRSLRVPDPVIDVRLLQRPAFATSVATMALVGFTMYTQLISLPLYLHRAHGWTGAGQGILTTGLGLGLLVSMSWASRRSDVTGPRSLVGPGAVITAAGLAVFALAPDHLPLGALFAVFVVVGLGFGAVAAPTFSGVYRTVPEPSIAQATTTTFIAVQLAASLGVTVVGLVLADATGDGGFRGVFTALVVALVVIGGLSRRLPGRPEAVPTEG